MSNKIKNIIKKLLKSVIRCVTIKRPVLDVENGKKYYTYRWELFRRFSIKTGYIPVEQYQDEQSEYLEIV